MNLTLYRKYRPATFDELTGQNHIKITLQNEIETGRISHAYLFCGPRGVGKTTAARIFAKTINCQNLSKTKNEPCGKCDFCLEIAQARCLDIIEIDAASNRGIDEIRDLREKVKYSPSRLKYKVYIVDEAHMLTIEAFNALLKTLEEPPAHSIFILVTTETHKLPETIISRCQRFDFKKINSADLISRLSMIVSREKKEVPDSVLQRIARHSEGCARDAESLLGQILSLGEKKISQEMADLVIPGSNLHSVLELVGYLSKKDAVSGIALVNKFLNEGYDLRIFTADLIEVLRKIMLIKIDLKLNDFVSEYDKDLEKMISVLVADISKEEIIFMIEKFISVGKELKFADIVQFPLEVAIVEICSRKGESRKDTPKTDELPRLPESKKKLNANGAVHGTALESSLVQIKKRWQEVLLCLKKYNNSLASALKTASPSNFENDTVQICFKYQFHQERFNEPKNRDLVENAFKEILGFDIRINPVNINELPEGKASQIEADMPKPAETGLDQILQAFGGKIVD
ncbi:DNA polymerase III subunit gamma/tau [Candidatus Parcubacteria bacterium]|nr:MAG: DNA polymerase III subunit gamma/tau [Candidatus Parcubacteria bacterium]